MKKILLLIAVISLTGCSTLIDGVLGRYHNYDSTEYALAVDLVHSARPLANKCPYIQIEITDLRQRAEYFVVYAEGRLYNKRTAELGQSLTKLLRDTESRNNMSAFFCRERANNIVRATETIRSVSGEKPE